MLLYTTDGCTWFWARGRVSNVQMMCIEPKVGGRGGGQVRNGSLKLGLTTLKVLECHSI